MGLTIFFLLVLCTGPVAGGHLASLSGRDSICECPLALCDLIRDFFCTSRDHVSLIFVYYQICSPVHDPLYSICEFLHESICDPIGDPLYTTHKFFHKSNMAANFRCKHKGRSTWDTHPSCVTCRIRNNLLCSRQNPCLFCGTWDEDCWALQDIRVDKVRRD